jgi:hypothetical protein
MFTQRTLRPLIAIGAPLLLGTLELGHSIVLLMGLYAPLGHDALWWTILRILQLSLFALIALGVILQVRPFGGVSAIAASVGMATFAVFYGAFDAIAGIGNGIIVHAAPSLDAHYHEVAEAIIYQMFASQPSTIVQIIGVLGLLVGIITTAVVLGRHGAPKGAVILLILGALIFATGHAPPQAPASMAMLALGFAWSEYVLGARIMRLTQIKFKPAREPIMG